MAREARIFSGIQPTGRKHLGNYIGAIRQYVEGQDRGEAIYCIVDLHAITVPTTRAELRERRLRHDGDPDRRRPRPRALHPVPPVRCPRAHRAVLAARRVTAWGDLNRMHQFKEKAEQQRELVSAGLFFYPVLQAADVFAYRATDVPVGDDQRQHIELMRDIAERFNARFGDHLVVPDGALPGGRGADHEPPGSREPDVDHVRLRAGDRVHPRPRRGGAKEGPKRRHRLRPEVRRGPDKAGVANLIEVLSAIRGVAPDEIESEFDGSRLRRLQGRGRRGGCVLSCPGARALCGAPPDEGAIEAILAAGAEKARAIAAVTVADVRGVMGLGPPHLMAVRRTF